jgi:hypothetical protein
MQPPRDVFVFQATELQIEGLSKAKNFSSEIRANRTRWPLTSFGQVREIRRRLLETNRPLTLA